MHQPLDTGGSVFYHYYGGVSDAGMKNRKSHMSNRIKITNDNILPKILFEGLRFFVFLTKFCKLKTHYLCLKNSMSIYGNSSDFLSIKKNSFKK
jgi:hypothetical protein